MTRKEEGRGWKRREEGGGEGKEGGREEERKGKEEREKMVKIPAMGARRKRNVFSPVFTPPLTF